MDDSAQIEVVADGALAAPTSALVATPTVADGGLAALAAAATPASAAPFNKTAADEVTEIKRSIMWAKAKAAAQRVEREEASRVRLAAEAAAPTSSPPATPTFEVVAEFTPTQVGDMLPGDTLVSVDVLIDVSEVLADRCEMDGDLVVHEVAEALILEPTIRSTLSFVPSRRGFYPPSARGELFSEPKGLAAPIALEEHVLCDDEWFVICNHLDARGVAHFCCTTSRWHRSLAPRVCSVRFPWLLEQSTLMLMNACYIQGMCDTRQQRELLALLNVDVRLFARRVDPATGEKIEGDMRLPTIPPVATCASIEHIRRLSSPPRADVASPLCDTWQATCASTEHI